MKKQIANQKPTKALILSFKKSRYKAAKELAKKGYKWSGHTHPGIEESDLTPSKGDYEILNAFGQKSTVIYNSKGKYRVIHLEDYFLGE